VGGAPPHASQSFPPETNPLDTCFFGDPTTAGEPSAQIDGPFHRWLTVEQIRKMERMRRETVLEAMNAGELPFEQRGRIRYARFSDVLAWEERRLAGGDQTPSRREVAPELADFAS
jgi:hypothetical protein